MLFCIFGALGPKLFIVFIGVLQHVYTDFLTYRTLLLLTYSYILISTFAVAKLVHISFTANSKGREAGLPINCFRTSVFSRCFDDCKGSVELHSSNS